MSDKTPNIHARLDRRRVRATRDTFAHLVVDIEAPHVQTDQKPPELPLNLALVIDASGSMQEYAGAPGSVSGFEFGHTRIDAAKHAAAGVVEQLDDHDVLSIVSFADDTIVHLAATSLAGAGRGRCMEAIHQIETRGCTDLNQGWLQGAEQIVHYRQESGKTRDRVLVLSDGYANEGVTEPDQLATTSRGLRERGIYTSTVGIGMDYSTEQLAVLAEHGGGEMHHAERAEDIVAVILAELRDVQATTMSDVEVTLTIDDEAGSVGATAHGYPVDVHDGIVTTALGSMVGGARRVVCFRLDVPKSSSHKKIPLRLSTTWRDTEGVARTSETKSMRLILDPNKGDHIDAAIAGPAAKAWLDVIVKEAFDRQGAGDDEVHHWVSKKLRSFKWYCRWVNDGDQLVSTLRDVRDRIRRPMQEATRRDILMLQRKSLRGVSDHRVADVQESLPTYMARE